MRWRICASDQTNMDFQPEATPGMLSEPGRRREETQERHAVAHQVDGEVAFPRREHVEGLAEGELALEVEGEVVELGCYV